MKFTITDEMVKAGFEESLDYESFLHPLMIGLYDEVTDLKDIGDNRDKLEELKDEIEHKNVRYIDYEVKEKLQAIDYGFKAEGEEINIYILNLYLELHDKRFRAEVSFFARESDKTPRTAHILGLGEDDFNEEGITYYIANPEFPYNSDFIDYVEKTQEKLIS